jgi:WD40 repeat protein
MTDPIPSTIPIRALEDHGDCVIAVAVFRYRNTLAGSCDERMVTASYDGILRLWDLKTGVVLMKMEGHRSRVRALAVSPDGQLIASGDESGGAHRLAWANWETHQSHQSR